MNLVPIEYKGQRVLTTQQLAEVYQTDSNNIKFNFNNQKSHFKESIHYYLLQGAELKAFKNEVSNTNLVGKNASQLYLWTERGANRHCKILETDKAWEQFDNLEETYFRVKENTLQAFGNLSPQLQLLINIETEQKKQALEIASTKERLDNIGDIISLDTHSWRKESKHLIGKIATIMGGFHFIKDVNAEIYRLLDERFGVSLSTRLTNKRRRMADEGICKSKRDKLTKVDIIADDKKLVEGYVAIIKEMAIKHGVDVSKLNVA